MSGSLPGHLSKKWCIFHLVIGWICFAYAFRLLPDISYFRRDIKMSTWLWCEMHEFWTLVSPMSPWVYERGMYQNCWSSYAEKWSVELLMHSVGANREILPGLRCSSNRFGKTSCAQATRTSNAHKQRAQATHGCLCSLRWPAFSYFEIWCYFCMYLYPQGVYPFIGISTFPLCPTPKSKLVSW